MNDLLRIIEVLDANKIPYNKQILKVYELGIASESCKLFFDETVGDLYKHLPYYVNNGFNRQSKEAVAQMVNLLVDQTDKKAEAKLHKSRALKKEYVETLAKEPQEYPCYTEIDKLLEFTRRGAEALDKQVINQEAKEIVNQTIELCNEIRGKIDRTWDRTSELAGEYQSKIYDLVYSAGDSLGSNYYSREVIVKLKTASELADKWISLKAYKKSKKETYKKLEEANSIISIARAQYGVDGLNTVITTLNQYKADIDRGIENENTLQAEVDDLQAKISKLEDQGADLTDKVDNGQISEDEYSRKIRDISYTIDTLQGTIDDKSYLLDSINRNNNNRKLIYSKVNDIIMLAKMFANEGSKFNLLTYHTDFETIARLLSTNITEDQQADAIFMLEDIRLKFDKLIKNDERVIKQINDRHQQTVDLLNKSRSSHRNPKVESEALKDRFRRKAPKQEAEVQQEVGIDDLLVDKLDSK